MEYTSSGNWENKNEGLYGLFNMDMDSMGFYAVVIIMLFGYAIVIGSIVMFNLDNKGELKSKLEKARQNNKQSKINSKNNTHFNDVKTTINKNLNDARKNLNDARIDKSIYENFNTNMSGYSHSERRVFGEGFSKSRDETLNPNKEKLCGFDT